jgi:hypothetical protein
MGDPINIIKGSFNRNGLRQITDDDAAYILSKKNNDINAAAKYAYELGNLCMYIPEWNWSYSGNPPLYVIRGFIDKSVCTAELKEYGPGYFIVRFSDTKPQLAIGYVANNLIITYVLIDHNSDYNSFTIDDITYYSTLSDCIMNIIPAMTQLKYVLFEKGKAPPMLYSEVVDEKRSGRQGGRRKYRMKRKNHAKKRTHRNKKHSRRKNKSCRRH